MDDQPKPTRHYFKTYMQMLYNSIGTNMFRNFYVSKPDRGEFDALNDGEDSCAFYVSSVLVLFRKIGSIHGTVTGLIADLENSGWKKVHIPDPGDVLIWEPQEFNGMFQEHVGIALGNDTAVSNSYRAKSPIMHNINFSEQNRKIVSVYRIDSWE